MRVGTEKVRASAQRGALLVLRGNSHKRLYIYFTSTSLFIYFHPCCDLPPSWCPFLAVFMLPQVRPDSVVPSPRASLLLEHLRHRGGHVERGLHLRGAAREEALFPGEEPNAPASGG